MKAERQNSPKAIEYPSSVVSSPLITINTKIPLPNTISSGWDNIVWKKTLTPLISYQVKRRLNPQFLSFLRPIFLRKALFWESALNCPSEAFSWKEQDGCVIKMEFDVGDSEGFFVNETGGEEVQPRGEDFGPELEENYPF